MKPIFAGLAVLLLAACSTDSDLPEASGKATLRSINAIATSGEIAFKIEERAIGIANYKDSTASVRFDDLDYTFNFDVFFAGDIDQTRFASQFLDVVAGMDYTFLVTGSLANPTITLFEDEEREFSETDTVFEAKFVHASASMGALDYYFADPTTPPAPGAQVATLGHREISTGADYASGDYVLTVTSAGDHTDVVYQSATVQIAPRDTLFITLFDGDANDAGPLIAETLPTARVSLSMPDPSYPARVEFVNVSMDLGAADIYDDEPLTSLIVQNHDYLDVTSELEVPSGANNFYYTPTGDTGAVILDGPLTAITGLRYRFYARGVAGALTTGVALPDRQPFETMAKLTMYNGANNFDTLDLYIVNAGESIDDTIPARAAILPGEQTLNAALEAGSYDIYITDRGEKVALAGPYRIDVVLRDIVDFVVVDTVDPAVLDVLFFSGGPAP